MTDLGHLSHPRLDASLRQRNETNSIDVPPLIGPPRGVEEASGEVSPIQDPGVVHDLVPERDGDSAFSPSPAPAHLRLPLSGEGGISRGFAANPRARLNGYDPSVRPPERPNGVAIGSTLASTLGGRVVANVVVSCRMTVARRPLSR